MNRAAASIIFNITVFTIGIALDACHLGGPAPAPPITGDDIDQEAIAAYGALFEAGCLPYDDAGATSLEQAHSSVDSPDWLNCMFDGGGVSSCRAPCGGDL